MSSWYAHTHARMCVHACVLIYVSFVLLVKCVRHTFPEGLMFHVSRSLSSEKPAAVNRRLHSCTTERRKVLCI